MKIIGLATAAAAALLAACAVYSRRKCVSTAAGPAARSGTAGTGAREDKVAQTRQTAQKQASASKSTPTATGMSGGRRPSSGTPARQEQRSPDERKSRRKPGNGRMKDGK